MTTEKKPVIIEMTEDELQEFQAMRRQKEEEAQALKEKEDRQAYRRLAEETVDALIPRIRELNEQLRQSKEAVYNAFKGLIDTKSDLFGTQEKQRSHTFRNADSTARITIGYHRRDAWDDTVEVGIEKVKSYVSSLAKDEETKTLVAMLLDLLAKDKQGNLQADKVLQLANFAADSQSDLFKQGVQIIQESYRPERTKLYIRAEEKNEKNAWVNIPLNITEA